jgi:hypothetical protein
VGCGQAARVRGDGLRCIELGRSAGAFFSSFLLCFSFIAKPIFSTKTNQKNTNKLSVDSL